MDILLAILLGVSLSAACGFRVFVPMFIASLAAHCGYLDLGNGFEWLGSHVALIAFGVATVLETGAYYIPVMTTSSMRRRRPLPPWPAPC